MSSNSWIKIRPIFRFKLYMYDSIYKVLLHVHGIIQSELQTSVKAPVDYKAIKEKDVGIIRTDGMMEEGLTEWWKEGWMDGGIKGRIEGWKSKEGWMDGQMNGWRGGWMDGYVD